MVTATDSTAGASGSQPITWIVAAPQVFVFGPADQANSPGDAVSLTVSAVDTAGHTLTYTATGLPDGLTMDATTGIISGTVASDAVSSTPYPVTITATDSAADVSGDATLNWTIGNVALDNPGTQYNFDGDTVSLPLTGSASGDPFTYSASGLPSGLTINATTGVISGTIAPGADADSPYNVLLSATDTTTDASTSVSVAWNVAATTVTVLGPGNGSSYAGVAVSLGMIAIDNAGHALTYSATGLPPGLSINTGTGAITGTIPTSAISATPYNVTVTATDSAADVSGSTSFDWTATPVSLTNPGFQRNLVGDTVDVALSASDALGDTITYSATNLPTGLSINASTGVISGAPTAAGAYVVMATATDSTTGASASQTFAWIVNAITLDNPGAQVSAAGAAISLALVANAPSGDAVTYSATGLPPGLTVSSSTGIISGTIAAGTSGDFAVSVSATDTTTGASAGGQIWWIVSSSITLSNPGSQLSTAGATVSLALTVSAPVGDTITYAATGLPPGLSINASTGAISGTITAGTTGRYHAIVTATDTTTGASSGQAFGWAVGAQPAQQPPTQAPVRRQFGTANQRVPGEDGYEPGNVGSDRARAYQNYNAAPNAGGRGLYTPSAGHGRASIFSGWIPPWLDRFEELDLAEMGAHHGRRPFGGGFRIYP